MPIFRSIAKHKFRLPPFGAYLTVVAGWFFGFGLQTTLFPGVILFTLGESEERLGIAQAALTAPMLLLLPIAGVVAERVDRRAIMFYFYIFAGLNALALSWLLITDHLSYWLIVGFALMVGVAGSFVMPARDSAINPVVRISAKTRHGGISIQKAVIMASAIQFGAQLSGMAAVYFAKWTGPGVLFLAQGIGLIFGGTVAAFMPRLSTKRKTSSDSVINDLKEGVHAVLTSKILFPMTLIMIAVGVFVVGGAFFVLIPSLIRNVYGGGFTELSSLMITFWIGAFFANIALVKFGQIERPGRILIYAQGVTVLAVGAFALPLPFWSLYGLVFAWGLGAGVAISLSRSVVQEHAPADKLARVMSVYQLGLFGGAPIGSASMGFIIGAIGPRVSALIPMIGLGVVLILISILTPIMSVKRSETSRLESDKTGDNRTKD